MSTQKSAFEHALLSALEDIRAGFAGETAVEPAAALGRAAFQTAVLAKLGEIATGAQTFSTAYTFSAVDFGAGNSTQVIPGNATHTGEIVAVSVYNVTEVFNTDTTQARVDLGDGADADAYALTANFGALAVNAALSPALTAGVTGQVPAGSDITATFVAPTGGAPNTGIADVTIVVRWTPVA